jgi:predicted nuclease of predicted toxin-antitoxin system
MDEHVPYAITESLRLRGLDVLTVQEDGRRHTDDDVLIDRATELGRLLFSADLDMLRHVARRQGSGLPPMASVPLTGAAVFLRREWVWRR